MIEVREAVKRSIDYLRELQAVAGKEVQGLLVEEVKRPDEDYWEITLSYLRTPAGMAEAVGASPKERAYKLFRVKADTGDIESMSIRNVHLPE